MESDVADSPILSNAFSDWSRFHEYLSRVKSCICRDRGGLFGGLRTFGICLSLCVVAACGPPKQSSEGGLPLVSLQHLPDGSEMVMTGKILPKMDYSSTFAIRAEDGQSCLGEFSPKGVGTMTCSDGLAMNLVVPKDQYGRTTGAFVHQDGGIGVAVGWGDKADVVLLRGMF